ncbi:glycosyltransferase [unidentified eubacterium SCB49]|nr:glycosyltransferase [unidentified eubacterium SCB49]
MKVSVIIPYYNRPKKLARCIASVQKQSHTNLEIIVIDDCSQQAPTSLDPSIVYKKNETNLGPGLSRNEGKALATGQFITFLDCDDYWHPTFLEKALACFLEQKHIAMVYANAYVVDASEKIIGLRRDQVFKISEILPAILQQGKAWGTGACLWKVSAIKNIQFIKQRTWEDYAFHIEAAIHCNKIAYLEEALVYLDDSGDDKLSVINPEKGLIDKAASLIYSAEMLLNSHFKQDKDTLNALKVQLASVYIYVAQSKATKEASIAAQKKIAVLLKAVSTPFFFYLISFVSLLPKRVAASFMYRLKKYNNSK